MSSGSSAPLSTPGSTACSTHASNEPYQVAMSDGFGFPASSIRFTRRVRAREPGIPSY
jgi:hypothetical protein